MDSTGLPHLSQHHRELLLSRHGGKNRPRSKGWAANSHGNARKHIRTLNAGFFLGLHHIRPEGRKHLHMDHNRWLAAVTLAVKLNSSGDTVGTEPTEELRPIRLNTGSDLCRHPCPSKLRLLRTRQTN